MKAFANRVMPGLLALSLLAWMAAAAQSNWDHKKSPTGVTAVWGGSIIDADGNSHPITFDLQENAGAVTGTVTGLPPNGDPQAISNGKVVEDDLSFNTPGPKRKDGSVVPVTFSGKIHGNQIQGSFTTPNGKMPAVVARKDANHK